MSESHTLPERSRPTIDFSIEQLAAYCAEETRKFFQQRASDTRFCFELLRRALAEQLPEALAHVFRIYEPLVQGWVRRHPRFEQTGEETAFFVCGALHAFYFALRGPKFGQFLSLEQLLKYMRMCVHSAIMQYLRPQSADVDRLPSEASLTPDYDENLLFDECWRRILVLIPDRNDRLLAHCYFILDMKPAEIAALYADIWGDTERIRVAMQRIRRILRHDTELRHRAGLGV